MLPLVERIEKGRGCGITDTSRNEHPSILTDGFKTYLLGNPFELRYLHSI